MSAASTNQSPPRSSPRSTGDSERQPQRSSESLRVDIYGRLTDRNRSGRNGARTATRFQCVTCGERAVIAPNQGLFIHKCSGSASAAGAGDNAAGGRAGSIPAKPV